LVKLVMLLAVLIAPPVPRELLRGTAVLLYIVVLVKVAVLFPM